MLFLLLKLFDSPSIVGHAEKLKVVLTHISNKDLLTASSLHGICALVDEFFLQYLPNSRKKSVASHIGELRNKTCSQINSNDVSFARDLLDACAPFYRSGKLKRGMTQAAAARAGVENRCCRTDFVYDVMHYFADDGFYDSSNKLLYTVAYIEYDKVVMDKTFYKDRVESAKLDNGVVRVVAVGFSNHIEVKLAEFEDHLVSDLTYFGLAGGLIAFFMVIYLLSFVMVIGTFVNICLSFGFAYFLYYYVCQMVFYPFINFLALLLLIAIGSDDVFVFYDTWQQVKTEHPSWTADQRLSVTFSHAITSIFVTSFTTAAAFLANCVSNITAIQCFGIFAALSITANFVMMVTIMPALVIATEACTPHVGCSCCAFCKKPYLAVGRASKFVFQVAIPFVVRRGWWACITVGLAIGIGALVTVFYKPALVPPTSSDFQLFNKENLLEMWDLDFKYRFPAENAIANAQGPVELIFVFGFKSTDPGNRFDPDDKTRDLSRDGDFEFEKAETRDWLRKFCNAVKAATFTQVVRSSACIVSTNDMSSFLLKHACNMFMSNQNSGPLEQTMVDCCTNNVSQTKCVKWAQQKGVFSSFSSRDLHYATGTPVFDENSVVGYRVSVVTTSTYSVSFKKMRASYNVASSFMEEQLRSAPAGLRSGFVSGVGSYTFYDLQNSLASGTYASVGLSIGVAFIVILLSVRNVLIAIYAMTTIMFAIACTISSIVLMGWKLNIIESLTITLAVGMSIDFTIHYGVVYQMSPEATSAGRTYESFVRVGSAVAAAAWTTFSAGIAVLNCSVDPYHKLGVFLVLVMVFSWTYSTFFFQSLCHIIGPVGNVAQLRCPAAVRQKCDRSKPSTDYPNNETKLEQHQNPPDCDKGDQ